VVFIHLHKVLYTLAEEPGFDSLLLLDLVDRLKNASKARFNDKLYIDSKTFSALDSKEMLLIQLADLYTGSINRLLNVSSNSKNHKDELAEYFFETFNLNRLEDELKVEDMTIHMSL